MTTSDLIPDLANPDHARLEQPDGHSIAYRLLKGRGPTVVFLGGFRSDMTGTKATALADWAAANGRAFVRFDWFGHGLSSGSFADGTIGRWRDDALAVLDKLTSGPVILVGSSMGGWIATLVARARRDRLAGLVTVAAAPDFTELLIWGSLNAAEQAALQRSGVHLAPSAHEPGPTPFTWRLVEEGRRHLLLGGPVDVDVPVRLHHGLADAEVPFGLSMDLAERLASRDVVLTLVKGGDHRLSTPADIARLLHDVAALADAAHPAP